MLFMDLDYYKLPQIELFFRALKTGKHVEWPIIGFMLLSAEHNQLWQSDCSSFTAWVRLFSKEIKKQESTCWRYFSAAKYYLQLKKILNSNGIECPVITALPESVSPENIELLEKLHRAMPEDQFLHYAQKTIENKIKRKELREAWSIYRPVLQGKTARGIKEAPRASFKDKLQFDSQAEAIALSSLINNDGFWVKKEASDFYKTFRCVELTLSIAGKDYIYKPDLLILTGSKKSKELLVHAVEYASLFNHQQLIEKLSSASQQVNYVWLMFNKDMIESINVLPQSFGLIAVHGSDNFEVIRAAQYSEVSQDSVLKQIVLRGI